MFLLQGRSDSAAGSSVPSNSMAPTVLRCAKCYVRPPPWLVGNGGRTDLSKTIVHGAFHPAHVGPVSTRGPVGDEGIPARWRWRWRGAPMRRRASPRCRPQPSGRWAQRRCLWIHREESFPTGTCLLDSSTPFDFGEIYIYVHNNRVPRVP